MAPFNDRLHLAFHPRCAQVLSCFPTGRFRATTRMILSPVSSVSPSCFLSVRALRDRFASTEVSFVTEISDPTPNGRSASPFIDRVRVKSAILIPANVILNMYPYIYPMNHPSDAIRYDTRQVLRV